MFRTKRFLAAVLASLALNALVVMLLGVSAPPRPLPVPPSAPPRPTEAVEALRPMPIEPAPSVNPPPFIRRQVGRKRPQKVG